MVLYNNLAAAAPVAVTWAELGLPGGKSMRVVELIAQVIPQATPSLYPVLYPVHPAMLLTPKPTGRAASAAAGGARSRDLAAA